MLYSKTNIEKYPNYKMKIKNNFTKATGNRLKKSIASGMETCKTIVLCSLLFFWGCKAQQMDTSQLQILKISENQRYFSTQDNQPFFWLGDTAWLLFSKLSREEAVKYMDDRAEKGFNVIQVMVLHELKAKNFYGASALLNQNVSQPYLMEGKNPSNQNEYDYWDHVDYIVKLAKEKGMYMAMVPVWGTNVKAGDVSLEDATKYADWLAKRYHQNHIIWLNGGDTKGNEHTALWKSMGETLNQNENQLITFHPFGRKKSSTWFHQEEWLDFNMFQSGYRRYDQEEEVTAHGQDNYKYVQEDYVLKPIKPTLDGEPSYESIPQGLHDPSEPYWTADDVRRYAYWSVFSGGSGFTYGHNAVMQMHKPKDENPAFGAREYWNEVLDSEGVNQMKHLKKLMLSVSYYDRVPDQSLVLNNVGEAYEYILATRGSNYAFVYTYTGKPMEIQLGEIAGEKIQAFWFNPKTGEEQTIGTYKNTGSYIFTPENSDDEINDWVLLLKSVAS
ncbi:MAG: glycoside hydrolase [Flavobacteriaceae bacterium]|nr:MAG: glycoside hydrolase [Flavobacteriaceae bacterium]